MEDNRAVVNYDDKVYFVEKPITVDKVVNAIIADMWGKNIEEELKEGYYPFYVQFLTQKEKIKKDVEAMFERRI